MAEYIERSIAKDELLSWAVCIKHPEHLMKEDAMHILDSIPAADVVPVVHGWWITYEGYEECNLCHHKFKRRYNYCPNCGARMDGE